jgi:hypothetical protein
MNMKIRVIFIFIILLFALNELFAQTGTIRGRIYNEKSNEPVPFANIVIFGTNIGSTSDLDGNFLFTGVQPGFIRLQASAVGFERRITEEFQVTNARNSIIDVPMREIDLQLQEVIVEAPIFQRKDESPVSLRRLGISEIERSPGSNRDISRVIQSLPGVAFTPSFRNDVIIRGGGPNENRFYLDGVEIPNLNHFATQGASGGPVGIINVDFIREVEMYSSAFPASRGNALSSVFEFRQVRGDSEKFNYRGTVGASDLALTVDGPLTANSSMILSLRRSYLQFLFSVIGLPFLPTYNDYQFKIDSRLSQNSELTIIGLGALDQFKLNLDANETENQRFILDYLPVNEQWNYTTGIVYRRFRSNGFERYVLSRNMLRNMAYKYPDNDDTRPRSFDYTSDEIENKLRYERTMDAGGYRLSFGAGGEYARYLTSRYQQIFLLNRPVIFDNNSSLDIFKWSIFGQVTRNVLSDKMTLSFGVRTDANNYSSSMSSPFQQLSPRISASYKLRENFTINASTGRYFQLPAYTTLGFRDTDGQLANKNNNLRYLAVNHYVAGIELLPTQRTLLTLEGFLKTYDRYPLSVADGVPIGSKPVDFGVFGFEEVLSTSTGRSYGMELLYREQRIRNLNVILSYTLVRSEFRTDAGEYIPSAWDNRHLINLTSTLNLPRNWNIGGKWRYSGGSPYTPFDLETSTRTVAWDLQRQGYPDYSNFNSLRLKPFHQLDMRIDKQFFFPSFSMMFYLDIQNVYNFQAELAPNLQRVEDASPFTDGSGIERYQLKLIPNTAGTVLPTIGIMFEF